MRTKLKFDEVALKRSKEMPGPGTYAAIETVGKSQTVSTIATPNNFSIGREARFVIPTQKPDVVAPGYYKPQDGLNEDFKSTFRKTAQTVFGKNNFSVIDQHFKTR